MTSNRLYVLLEGDWNALSQETFCARLTKVYMDIQVADAKLDARVLLPCKHALALWGAPELEALVGSPFDPNDVSTLAKINGCRAAAGLGALAMCEVAVGVSTSAGATAGGGIAEGMEGNANLPMYSEVCMGGTYDRMHIGHKLLLSHAALVSDKRLFCGIMGPESLQSKSMQEMLETLAVRTAVVQNFLTSIKPSVEFQVVHIPNPYGPSITDPTFDAIVVSEETRAGGDACNAKRALAQMSPMAVFGVDVIDGDQDDVVATGGKETKVSSSGQRKKTLGQFKGSPEGWYRQTLADDVPYCIGTHFCIVSLCALFPYIVYRRV